jgi:hypothetical protein
MIQFFAERRRFAASTPRNDSVWSGSGSIFVTPDSIRQSSIFCRIGSISIRFQLIEKRIEIDRKRIHKDTLNLNVKMQS